MLHNNNHRYCAHYQLIYTPTRVGYIIIIRYTIIKLQLFIETAFLKSFHSVKVDVVFLELSEILHNNNHRFLARLQLRYTSTSMSYIIAIGCILVELYLFEVGVHFRALLPLLRNNCAFDCNCARCYIIKTTHFEVSIS